LKDSTIVKKLKERFNGKGVISTKELTSFLRKQYPGVAEQTIGWKIYQLKDEGILKHVSRGMYSFSSRAKFIPPVSDELKKLYKKLKGQFPLLNLCVWDTRWLNSFMLHQPGRFYLIVETEKDGMEPVFHFLLDSYKNVFLNPDKQTIERYVANAQESIIVKSLVTEAPLHTVDSVHTSSLEKLLVDCLSEPDLLAAQRSETEHIFREAFERYNVNINKARRYARRRDRINELEKKTLEVSYGFQ